MARKARVEFPGAVYHLLDRGDRQKAIFHDDTDRRGFLTALGQTSARTGWRVHSWVLMMLMTNHYHLLVATPEANLVAGMRWLQTTWTIRFNRRHHLAEHLFQGRYKSIVVDPKERSGRSEAGIRGAAPALFSGREKLESQPSGRRRPVTPLPRRDLRVFVRPMRASFCLFALLGLIAQNSFADSGRTALQSTPLIEGRAINRIQLLAPLVVNDSRFAAYVRDAIEVRIPAGTFTPVSEDRKGVFFQAANAFARLKFPGPVSGGFYLAKARQNRVTAYVGDARAESRQEVDKAKISLTADQFRYFRFDASPSPKR